MYVKQYIKHRFSRVTAKEGELSSNRIEIFDVLIRSKRRLQMF